MSRFLEILRTIDALQDEALSLTEGLHSTFPRLTIEDGKVSLSGTYEGLLGPKDFRDLCLVFAELGGVQTSLDNESRSHRITSDDSYRVCKICEQRLLGEFVAETAVGRMGE